MKHTLDTIPVIPVEQAGHSFLVAPYGEVQWIRNLRAAGTATLTRSRRSETIPVTELPAQEAALCSKRNILEVFHHLEVRQQVYAMLREQALILLDEVWFAHALEMGQHRECTL